jgi:branched-chain amino acid transport system substrate-binding protein
MHEMSSWHRSLVVVVALGLAAGGCTSGSDSADQPAPTEVRIGLLVPLKGPNQGAGADAQRGAQLAADVVNSINTLVPLPMAEDAGLVNLGNAHIRIITADTQSDPQIAANEVTRLVTEQGAVALVGAYDAEATVAASQRSERIPIPFVNGDSGVSFLTQRGLDWFFRTGPSVRTAGEAFFSLLLRQRSRGQSVSSVAVLHSSDKTGIDVMKVVGELADEGGYKVIKEVSFDPAAKNLTAQVGEVQAANPDVVFVAPTVATTPVLISAFGARQYKPKAVMAYGSGFLGDAALKSAGQVGTGLCREVAWSNDLATRNLAASRVKDLYQRKYNAAMSEEAASTFTAVLTLAMAINDAKSADPRRIRAALLSLDVAGQDTIMPWQGIRFDETHQNVDASTVVEQFLDRTFHPVYPLDSRVRDFVWPAASAA